MTPSVTKTIVRLLFGVGGPGAALLIRFGMPADQIGPFVDALAVVLGLGGPIAAAILGELATRLIANIKTIDAHPDLDVVPRTEAGRALIAQARKPVSFSAASRIGVVAAFIGLLGLPLLGGCSTFSGAPGGSTLDKLKADIALAQGVYDTARIAVAYYGTLTPCGADGATALCYDANAGRIASDALDGLKVAIANADNAIAKFGTDGVDIQSVVDVAIHAATDIVPLLAQYGVK